MRPYSLGNVKRKASFPRSFLRTAGTVLASAGVATFVFVAMGPCMRTGECVYYGFDEVIGQLLNSNILQAVLLAFTTLYALLAVTVLPALALLATALSMLLALIWLAFATLLSLLPLIGLACLCGRLWAGPGRGAPSEHVGARAEP